MTRARRSHPTESGSPATGRAGAWSARPWLALAALLLVAGCAIIHEETGRPVPPADGALIIGTTTKADALALLGPPVLTLRQHDGDLLVWRRDVFDSSRLLLVPLIPIYENTDASTRSDVVTLLFDRAGVLRGRGEQRDL